MRAPAFVPFTLPQTTESLRSEVRAFLADRLAGFPTEICARSWDGYDPAFSRAMGERGWIGMTWPQAYGGGGRSAFERYVVLEEMLAAGAPVAFHWIADRQSGPLLLRYGTEAQRERFLPAIARGELCFCIGMSEPDSGSDLASIRSRAEKVKGGWRLNGTKIWTTGAHVADYMIGLFRSERSTEERHEGMSQFIVDLKNDGIGVRPILDLTGRHQFNEVVFEDVVLPEEALIGAAGDGWRQVTAELALERSGPERYLSSYILLRELIRRLGDAADEMALSVIGRQVAHLVTLRNLSVSVAARLEAGENPALEAALVKDLGSTFEQALPGLAQSLVDDAPRNDSAASDYQRVLHYLVQAAPSFSLRGGTREILKAIVARGLGLR